MQKKATDRTPDESFQKKTEWVDGYQAVRATRPKKSRSKSGIFWCNSVNPGSIGSLHTAQSRVRW